MNMLHLQFFSRFPLKLPGEVLAIGLSPLYKLMDKYSNGDWNL